MLGRASCGKLLSSWLLIAVALLLMTLYGKLGVLAAILPLGAAQALRGDHDKTTHERARASGLWRGFALFYYLGLLAVTVYSVTHGIRLTDLPIVAFIVLIMFPFLTAMFVNDIAVCSSSTTDNN